MGDRPLKAYWTLDSIPGAKCLDQSKVSLGGGAVKTFIDFYVTTLPIPLVFTMKMDRWQKYGTVLLLGLGYLVTAAGAIRLYYTWKLFYNSDYDYTWMQYPAFLASAVENDLAVVWLND
jgi:hypothetical protein